jgi:hypothetical protein
VKAEAEGMDVLAYVCVQEDTMVTRRRNSTSCDIAQFCGTKLRQGCKSSAMLVYSPPLLLSVSVSLSVCVDTGNRDGSADFCN